MRHGSDNKYSKRSKSSVALADVKLGQLRILGVFAALAVVCFGAAALISSWTPELTSPVLGQDVKQGKDGCFPVDAQKANKAPVSGAYDILLLARWSLDGLCAVHEDRLPICARARHPNEVTTTIRGLWPVRSSCLDYEEFSGHYWPQYCTRQHGELNGTAFGMLAALNPARGDCTDKLRWPAEWCDRLSKLQQLWPAPLHNPRGSDTEKGSSSTAGANRGGGRLADRLKAHTSKPPSKDASAEADGGGRRPGLGGGLGGGGHESGAVGGPSANLAASRGWQAAWERHGSCSGMHPEEYFDAALAADKAALEADHFDTKTVGPNWPRQVRDPFKTHLPLTKLTEHFGGAWGASFHCDKGPDGELYLTSVKQCVSRNEEGLLAPEPCPRWVIQQDESCKPPGTAGPARVWLGKSTAMQQKAPSAEAPVKSAVITDR